MFSTRKLDKGEHIDAEKNIFSFVVFVHFAVNKEFFFTRFSL